MVVNKFSISLSSELAVAIRSLAEARGDEVSRLVETLLRENWIVAVAIQRSRERASGDPGVRDREVRERLLRTHLRDPFIASEAGRDA